MNNWLGKFNHDPVASFLEYGDKSISLFVKRDLLDQTVSAEDLWQLPEPRRILRKQQADGSWLYPAAKENIRTQENYNQIETYRNLGILVEEFGFNKKHPAIQNTAEYLFTFQTREGDFRGIYGNQYSPNYTAGITELLIKAGYENDARIKRVFEWLISIRQDDGGWAIPFRTQNKNLNIIASDSKPIEPGKEMPFSHLVTGVVLRAFAAHPIYSRSEQAQRAGQHLLSNLFKRDHYPDRAATSFWFGFSYPFWFTDLLSALDSLSLLRFSRKEPQINKALQWFVENQRNDGLWELRILKGQNKKVIKLYLSLAICRVFKRFY